MWLLRTEKEKRCSTRRIHAYMYDMYVRHVCASHTCTGAGRAGAGEGAGAGAGAPAPPAPAPAPAPVCTGARNDSSKALSSSAVPLGSPRSSTSLPAHCKFNASALPSTHPSTLTHPLSVSASRGERGERKRARARERERDTEKERESARARERGEGERPRETESERERERERDYVTVCPSQ